jgi:streptomycin 6-kinase
MNDEFVKNAEANGEEGREWLNKIPDIIKQTEERWSLKVLPPFKLNYNYVAPVQRADGSKAVLKIGFPKDKEFKIEIEALEVFNGEGIERLLEVDRENWAILIEQVTPGVPLSEMGDDEEATKILASVMKKLWKPLPEKNNFITISEWMKAIPEYMDRHRNSTGPLPINLVEKAQRLFEELIATSEKPVLVHGDLHHDNVLSSDRDDWLAIDPKGIAAERAYETAAMTRNPYETMKDVKNLKEVLTNRIMILSKELDLDPQRVLKWGLAQTVLSAVWNVESAKGPDHAIKIAEVLDTISI